jgi:hypothetical protein
MVDRNIARRDAPLIGDFAAVALTKSAVLVSSLLAMPGRSGLRISISLALSLYGSKRFNFQ